MIDDEKVILHSNDVFSVEVRGFDHIPEPERNMTLRQVDQFWVGNSANLLSFTLGALAIAEGLSLPLALLACVVGSILYAYVGLASIVAVRAGLPTSTLTRAAFGIRGNLPQATLCWAAGLAYEVINIIFGVEALLALFELLGWSHPGAIGKLVATGLQLMLCGGIAVLGHATMVWFERVFAVIVTLALALVFLFVLSHPQGSSLAVSHVALSPGATMAAFLTACAILASNPLSYLFNGADFVRYLPSDTPGKSVFWHVFWASYAPSLALTMTGAFCATLGDMSDPVAGLKPLVPNGLFIVYIFAVIGGSVANAISTYYSSGLTLQAMGLKVHRYTATSIDVILSTAIALYVLFVRDFTTTLNDFVALLVVWVGPFAGVWICDAYLRRGKLDFRAIHSNQGAGGRYWGWHGYNLTGYVALLAGMTTAALTMKSPVFVGPLAAALGGADLSWILGLPVSALVYAGLANLRARDARGLGLAPPDQTAMSPD